MFNSGCCKTAVLVSIYWNRGRAPFSLKNLVEHDDLFMIEFALCFVLVKKFHEVIITRGKQQGAAGPIMCRRLLIGASAHVQSRAGREEGRRHK
jgi:hypothetical protein